MDSSQKIKEKEGMYYFAFLLLFYCKDSRTVDNYNTQNTKLRQNNNTVFCFAKV